MGTVGSSFKGRAGATLFIAVIIAVVTVIAFLPASSNPHGVLLSVGPSGTVFITGFASLRVSVTPWIAVWVKFTNGTGFTYYGDIGGPNYDPVIGGTYSVELPDNSVYTVQITGQILGHQMSCMAGTLTLNATSAGVRHNYTCLLPNYP